MIKTAIYAVLIGAPVLYALGHRAGSRKQLFAFSALFFIDASLTLYNVNNFTYRGLIVLPAQALVFSVGLFITSALYFKSALKKKD